MRVLEEEGLKLLGAVAEVFENRKTTVNVSIQ
jgi:hypothetical protein